MIDFLKKIGIKTKIVIAVVLIVSMLVLSYIFFNNKEDTDLHKEWLKQYINAQKKAYDNIGKEVIKSNNDKIASNESELEDIAKQKRMVKDDAKSKTIRIIADDLRNAGY